MRSPTPSEQSVAAGPTRTPAGSVVVAVDGSPAAARAIAFGADDATRRDAPLHLVHAYELHPQTGPGMTVPDIAADDADRARQAAWGTLAAAVLTAERAAPELTISTELVLSSPAGAIVDASQRATLVVLGARGLGALGAAVLGSVSMDVVRHAACPVVVVKDRDDPARPRDGVVLGVDAEGVCAPAIELAFEEAAARGTGLDVVHAWRPGRRSVTSPLSGALDAHHRGDSDAAVLMAEALAGFAERYPHVTVRRSVERGDVEGTLLRHAEGAQLLVVGSRGRGVLTSALLGSTSRQLLRHAACPVAVVRAL